MQVAPRIWPVATGISAGSLPRQMSMTSGQRGLNLQPCGRFVIGGTMPAIVGSR